MRSYSKDGSVNETMILNTLNNRVFKNLSDKWKRHMKKMFKDIDDNDYIRAQYHEFKDAKPDIEIIVGNKKVLLSIKSGHAPAVHQESVPTFYKFLRSLSVPEDIIDILAFYHYGYMKDPYRYTPRYTREEIIVKYPELIQKVNSYFDSHPEIVTEIAYRAVIRGRLKRDLIDYLYYGNAARGFLLSTGEIQRLIVNTPNQINQTICFKQLTYVSVSRDPNSPNRHKLRIHWPILCKYFYDEEFMKRYG